MTRRHLHLIGTGVIVLAIALFVTLIARNGPWTIWMVYLLYAVVGGLVLRHSARNPIGISLAVMGLVPLLGNLAELAVAEGAPAGFVGDLASWISAWYFYVFFGAFLPLFHVFPTGRPMPGVWRWWYRVALFGVGSLIFVYLFGPPDAGVNPFEIPGIAPVGATVGVLLGLSMTIGLVTGVVSLAVRFRRSRGRERDQMKWFFFSVVVAVVLFLGSGLLAEGLGWIPVGLGEVMASSAFPLPAVRIFFAVVRHGLFDIDRVVSRTISYAVVALALTVVYVLPVILIPEVFGLSSDLAVAGATLAAAAVFNPLRRRVRSVVARRFDRQRYDAERVLTAFSGRLQTAIDLRRVTDELGYAVREALHPESVSVSVSAEGRPQDGLRRHPTTPDSEKLATERPPPSP